MGSGTVVSSRSTVAGAVVTSFAWGTGGDGLCFLPGSIRARLRKECESEEEAAPTTIIISTLSALNFQREISCIDDGLSALKQVVLRLEFM
jgi:hypothetical protein